MKVYVLIKKNFEGGTYLTIFGNKSDAIKAFNGIVKKYSNANEFECDDQEEHCCSWFDPNYNEDSTFVYILEKKVK